MRFVAKLIIALAAAMAFPAAAQEIPGRVGRVAHIEGSVALYQDPEEGWERAYVNSPFTSENSVWTDVGSRAELRVGGTALRLDEATQLDIGQLVYEELDAYVPRGTVAVRVRHYDRDERIAFTTPHARFLIRANGRYRVDVDPEREESRLTVFTGEARVGSDSGRLRVQSGQTVRIFGGAAPSYVVERAFNDPFDRWAQVRDDRWVESRSVQYVSHYMTGYEDLDRYGEWREEPEFGALWFPTRVEADWAPYRYGRWDYVRPWGWTWVDDAPWGYAPFHYGRWVYVGNRWGWHPGPRDVRPVWAPALVAWVGGSNFSFGVSTGGPSVGWYPLSPWDRYQPWYNASPTYVNQINIVVRSDRPQREESRRWHEYTRERGVTVVNREALIERRPVQQAVVRVNPEQIKQLSAASVTQPAQVLPTRQEVVQRRAATRAQAQQAQPVQPGQAAQPAQQGRPGTAATAAGVAAGAAAVAAARSASRPEFQRARQAPPQAAQAPEPAKTAPPPAQRVTVPNQTRQATQPAAREREAAAPGTREDATRTREAQQAEQRQRAEQQQQAREEQAKGREAQQAEQRQRVEQQQKAREEQVKGRAAEQRQRAEQAREEQAKGREAEQRQRVEQQQKAREEQVKGREAQQAEQRQRAEQQQQARDEQAKGREAQQAEQRQRVEQQQQAREAQQREQQKAREDAARAREGQQAEQRQRVEQQQQQMREAQQRSQQQAQERAQQQKAAPDRAQQQQERAQQRAPQPQQAQQAQERAQQQQQQAQERAQAAQQRAQQRREQAQERAKAREEQQKEKEEEEKKARGR